MLAIYTTLLLTLLVLPSAHGGKRLKLLIKRVTAVEEKLNTLVSDLADLQDDVQTLQEPEDEDETCPLSWYWVAGKCVKFSKTAMPFGLAAKTCETLGSELLTISSKEEQDLVASKITSTNEEHVVTYFTPDQYKYVYLHDLGIDLTRATSVRFYVQACNDAHIALSERSGVDTRDTYEIVIGGSKNTASVIRECKQCAQRVYQRTSVLNCKESRPFWISWRNSYLRVGAGLNVGERQFLAWKDTTPFQIHYMAISTGWGATGHWKLVQETYNTGRFWIGASDGVAEGKWQWLPSKSAVAGYSNWMTGQPDNMYGNQDCMALDLDNGAKWRDNNCFESFNFICQKNITLN